VDLNRFAPRGFDHNRFSARAFNNVSHALAKDAVDANHHVIARLDHVDEGCFHSRAARRRNWDRHAVLGFKNVPQQTLHIVHALQK
jgi:hypothetical protein